MSWTTTHRAAAASAATPRITAQRVGTTRSRTARRSTVMHRYRSLSSPEPRRPPCPRWNIRGSPPRNDSGHACRILLGISLLPLGLGLGPDLGPAGQADDLAGTCELVATVIGSGLAQERWNLLMAPSILIERDVQSVADADLAPVCSFQALGEDLDARLEGRPADVGDLGDHLDPLTDEDRTKEDHRVHGRRGDLAMADVPQRGDRSALVGQPEHDAAVQRAIEIGLSGHDDDRQADTRRGRRPGGQIDFHRRRSLLHRHEAESPRPPLLSCAPGVLDATWILSSPRTVPYPCPLR